MTLNPLTSKLSDLGINESAVSDFQILCLPENFFEQEEIELYDADHAVDLSKRLKQQNLKCANSYDLGIEPDIYFRKSADLYFGVVYVLEKAVIPVLVSVLSTLLILKSTENKEKTEDNAGRNVNIDLYLPNGKRIKYDGDSEAFLKILKEIEEE